MTKKVGPLRELDAGVLLNAKTASPSEDSSSSRASNSAHDAETHRATSNVELDERKSKKSNNPMIKSVNANNKDPNKGELSSIFRLTPLSMLMNNKVSSSSLLSGSQSQQNLINRNLQPGPNLQTGSRRVRDSGSLLLMLCFLGFLAYTIWDGVLVKENSLDLIVHGYDSYGNICGQNNKPIKFVDKSGKNYTNKPYTKYTLINAYFERYQLVSDRLINPGEIYYVKDSLDMSKFRNQLLASNRTGRRRSDWKASESQPPMGSTLDHLNKNRSNSTALSILKTSLMYQYPPSYQSTDHHVANPRVVYRQQPQVVVNRDRPTSLVVGQIGAPTDLVTAQSIAHPLNTPSNTELINNKTTMSDSDDDPSFDHVLVNGTVDYKRPVRPRVPDILSQNEVTNQLLYLTECVDFCPNDHLELIFYRCIPKNWRFSLFPNAINVTRTFIGEIITDVTHCYRELIYTFSFALALSLALLILLRFLASFIIWSCLSVLISLLVSTAGYSWLTFYYQIIDLNDLTPNDSIYSERMNASDKWLVGSIFLTFIALAIIVAVIFMRKRILLVTTLFRESGKAIADMPLLLIQPLLTFASLVLITSVWSIALICLQSIKVPVIDRATGFVVYKAETFYKIMKWYNIFAFLWISHFAIACQHYVIGASVSKWFFSTDRYNLHSPIGSSVSELILYYLGSVALGSFLVAIFKVVRIVMRQIQYLIQRNCMSGGPHVNSASLPSSDALSPPMTSSCCGSLSYVWRLFIWFLDKIVMIISRDAYVEIAIHGYSFIGGAQRAFTVLASNPLRLLAIKTVSNLLLTVAKICVVFCTISMAMLLLDEKSSQLNYSWSPIVISALYAYIVAHWFLSVYEMVIDALFICYCEDYERTKNQDHITASNQQTMLGSNFMSQILRDNGNNMNNSQIY